MNKQDTLEFYKTTNKLFSTNEGVEIINPPKILRSKKVPSKILSPMSEDDIPMVTYKL